MGSASGLPPSRHGLTVTPGAPVPARYSPALALCWRTTRVWTCGWSTRHANRIWWWWTVAFKRLWLLIFIAGRALFIYAAVQNDEKKAALEAQGATVICLPGQTAQTQDKVDLKAMLADLAKREVNELHVEAGNKLNGSLIREGLVDEFVVYLAPKLIGMGRDMANFGPLAELSMAVPLLFKSTELIGPDLRIVARISGRDQF